MWRLRTILTTNQRRLGPMEELRQKYCNWTMIYGAITVLAVIALKTSSHPIAAFPAIIITFTSLTMGFKLIGKLNKLDKREKVEEVQREINEQERRAKIKSYYKK
jgi:hypothetical protein